MRKLMVTGATLSSLVVVALVFVISTVAIEASYFNYADTGGIVDSSYAMNYVATLQVLIILGGICLWTSLIGSFVCGIILLVKQKKATDMGFSKNLILSSGIIAIVASGLTVLSWIISIAAGSIGTSVFLITSLCLLIVAFIMFTILAAKSKKISTNHQNNKSNNNTATA